MTDAEMAELEKAIEKITRRAREFGLDFFEMRYEICPADIIYTFGAYGMPTRFSHWSFGKAFHRMKTQYDYNLSRIYELVINSDPCYAFLLDGNTLLQNKVIAAHVLAHCDFFKNNARFAQTSRFMIDTMAASAERIHHYEFVHGREKVEEVLDAVLALQDHVDPYRRPQPPNESERKTGKAAPPSRPSTPYDDLWELDERLNQSPADSEPAETAPEAPEYDLLYFLAENGRYLEDWERDVISLIREESLYFRPQMETKIMNEGWASLWHARIMRSLDLSDEEALEFARMHAAVLAPSRFHINPYFVGMKIFEDIERRWNEPSEEERRRFGRTGGQGLEKIFEVRQLETDVSFLRNYLTKELVEELDLYLYRHVDGEWRIVEKDWERVRDGLVKSLTNCGIPVIGVIDDDYHKQGELYLRHDYDGQELDVKHLEKTLPYVYRLWGRPVHLETVLGEKRVVFSYDGAECRRHSAQRGA
ncbi:MAG TPA: SpoVR family protein [Limnochordia bacterium]